MCLRTDKQKWKCYLNLQFDGKGRERREDFLRKIVIERAQSALILENSSFLCFFGANVQRKSVETIIIRFCGWLLSDSMKLVRKFVLKLHSYTRFTLKEKVAFRLVQINDGGWILQSRHVPCSAKVSTAFFTFIRINYFSRLNYLLSSFHDSVITHPQDIVSLSTITRPLLWTKCHINFIPLAQGFFSGSSQFHLAVIIIIRFIFRGGVWSEGCFWKSIKVFHWLIHSVEYFQIFELSDLYILNKFLLICIQKWCPERSSVNLKD